MPSNQTCVVHPHRDTLAMTHTCFSHLFLTPVSHTQGRWLAAPPVRRLLCTLPCSSARRPLPLYSLTTFFASKLRHLGFIPYNFPYVDVVVFKGRIFPTVSLSFSKRCKTDLWIWREEFYVFQIFQHVWELCRSRTEAHPAANQKKGPHLFHNNNNNWQTNELFIHSVIFIECI